MKQNPMNKNTLPLQCTTIPTTNNMEATSGNMHCETPRIGLLSGHTKQCSTWSILNQNSTIHLFPSRTPSVFPFISLRSTASSPFLHGLNSTLVALNEEEFSSSEGLPPESSTWEAPALLQLNQPTTTKVAIPWIRMLIISATRQAKHERFPSSHMVTGAWLCTEPDWHH